MRTDERDLQMSTDEPEWNTPNLNVEFPAGARSGLNTVQKQLDKWNKANVNIHMPVKQIAFIGDSYCADLTSLNVDKQNRYYSWPELVARQFNAEILQIGFAGLSFVSAFYNAYVRHYKRSILEQADIIIACVSSPDRLPNRHGIPFSPGLASKLAQEKIDRSFRNRKGHSMITFAQHHIPPKYLKACKAYYENIYSAPFHYIGQKGTIRELDDIAFSGIKKPNQIIIWLPCFQDSMCDFYPNTGIMSDAPLFDLFTRDAYRSKPGLTRKQITEFDFEEDLRISNHIMEQTQNELAKHLINYIENKKKFDILPRPLYLHGYTIPIKDMLK